MFAYDQFGMIHADFWEQASLEQYPKGSIMTPYVGSHDTARFATLATYRGQPGFDQGIPGNQWDNVAGPPQDAEPYQRLGTALSWLLGLPGAPLLYYGDEYGEWGGADPGNRAMWRGDGSLNADEQNLLGLTRKLGTARQQLVALRRGAYRSLYATETVLVYARQTDDGKVAVVAVSRDGGPTTSDVTVPASVPSERRNGADRPAGRCFGHGHRRQDERRPRAPGRRRTGSLRPIFARIFASPRGVETGSPAGRSIRRCGAVAAPPRSER